MIAITIATDQCALGFRLRTVVSLGRQLRDRGARERARDILRWSLGQLGPDFRSRDHLEATRLLAELEDGAAATGGV